MKVYEHLELLGKKVEDKVTGLSGIVTSLCFDLFGCIQACIDPGIDKDGKQKDRHWYDVSRLDVVSKKPVMKQPDFVHGPVAAGTHGPADKPQFSK